MRSGTVANAVAHRGVELVDELGEGGVVGGVVVGVVGVALGHVVADDLGVAHGQRRVGPQVGVGLAAVLGEREVVDVLVLGDGQRAELDDLGAVRQVGLGQLRGRLLELEAVDEDDVGGRQQLGHARLRLERVRVGALGDDARDVGPVADDVGDDAGDRRDRGGDQQATAVVRRRDDRTAAAGGEGGGGGGQAEGQGDADHSHGRDPTANRLWLRITRNRERLATSRRSVSSHV